MTAPGPLVTVFTPCFNHEPFLDEYFAGLLAQTYENVELIIVDDDSADGSWEKIVRYLPTLERKFTRVVAERHENIGPTRELLRMWDELSGELVCILESDDFYLPTKLEENVRFLSEHPEMGVVHSDTDFIHPDWIERSHWRTTRESVPTGFVFEDLLLTNFVMLCAFCCRMHLFREHTRFEYYLEQGWMARDYAFCLDLARHTPFGYIDKPLVRYRVRPGSWSRPTSPEAHFRFHRSLLSMRVDYADGPTVSPEVAERLRREYHEYIYRHGLALGRRADHEEGYRWLHARDPRRYGGLKHWLAARVVRRQVLWRIGERTGALKLGWRTWRALARRRRLRHAAAQARRGA